MEPLDLFETEPVADLAVEPFLEKFRDGCYSGRFHEDHWEEVGRRVGSARGGGASCGFRRLPPPRIPTGFLLEC